MTTPVHSTESDQTCRRSSRQRLEAYGRIPALEKQVEQATARLAELQAEQKMLKEEVDEEDVAEVVSRATGIPVSRLMQGEVAKLVRREDVLHARVVGQDQAVPAVANAIRRSRSGLADRNRPIGSFLFLGPAGAGKTELARTLAEFLFDDERAMVRLDMSEYMQSRLVGAPPGYVGYDEGGQLTEAIRRRPYAVVLPGDPADFFKPEFINRIDEIVRFRPLTTDDIAQVLDIQLHQLEARLSDRKLALEVSEDARRWLAERGDDPDYGARPLKRLICRAIVDPLALELLSGVYWDGDTVHVGVAGDELVLK
jgi:ATP-dependent Clp protease ATP-binding subunit ClpB